MEDIEEAERHHQVEVEYFANERSFKQRLNSFFFKNQRSSLCIRIGVVLIKIISCICYAIRVCLDEGPDAAKCFGCEEINLTNVDAIDKNTYLEKPTVNYLALVWVQRPYSLWVIQIVMSSLSLFRTCVFMYLTYKGNIVQQLTHPFFLLECVTSIPFLITICATPLINLFVPMFLNCWVAKMVLENLLNDLHRAMQKSHSAVAQQLTILLSTLICLFFTAACGMQHIQRAGRANMSLFQSFYFSIVTFSTVGYGEFYPDIWMSQLLVIGMICVTFIVIPKQVEQLLLTWIEKQKSGGEYSMHRAKAEKHVVLCTTVLRADVMYDFLNEFYAHPLLQDYFVLLLSPNDLDNSMKMLLQVPLWSQRVIYMKGAALKDGDLERVRLTEAEGCFLLANKDGDKTAADQQTILRSWAVRDFAPKCPQYIQIFRPENKMHVKHAEYVVCEDEFKYALLANNCICPGISTLITLLLHTSRGEEGQESEEEWHRLYGRHSGNEIYHIKVSQSKLLSEFVGKSFTYASFHAHRKYGVTLLAVQKDKVGSTIQLNPGVKHTIRGTDICYYVSVTEEEQMTLLTKDQSKRRSSFTHVATTIAGIGTVALELQDSQAGNNAQTLGTEPNNAARRPSIGAVPEVASTIQTPQQTSDDAIADIKPGTVCPICKEECQEREYIRGFPPVTPYIGTSATLCYLVKKKKPLCCLQLAQGCAHCSFTTADQYNWKNSAIILVADCASNGIYNFIIPLRAHYRPSHALNPIILLLRETPQNAFLDTISFFPQIYWMVGNIENVDNLLRAGILLSQHVIVVNKELGNRAEEDYLADAGTIVTVQTISRFFPQIRLFTELSQATNMRFMQFNAKDVYALHQSKIEKIEKDRGSHIAFMFRLPFAAGNVFSAAMLDTLLYQAFVKTYLIQIVRLLLGIDQSFGSGYLSSIEIREEDIWLRSYGRLYQKLCSTDGDIPIGLFRNQRTDSNLLNELGSKNPDMQDLLRRKLSCKYLVSERHEVENLVRNRLLNLGLEEAAKNYKCEHEKRDSISYVVINPSAELKLEVGDIVYVIKPSNPLLKAGITPSPMPYRKATKDGTQKTSSPTGLTTGGKEVIGRLSPSNDQQSVPKLTITFSSPAHDHSNEISLNSVDECEPDIQQECNIENETEPLSGKSGPKIIKFLKR